MICNTGNVPNRIVHESALICTNPHEFKRPLLLVLNKSDRYSHKETESLLGHLRDRCEGLVSPENIIAASADPRPETVIQIDDRGREHTGQRNRAPTRDPFSAWLGDLAGQFWALTIDTIPSYHYVYFMWDLLATSYLSLSEHFTVEEVRANVSNRPPNAGQTILTKNGYRLLIATDVKKEIFYNYIFDQLKTEIS